MKTFTKSFKFVFIFVLLLSVLSACTPPQVYESPSGAPSGSPSDGPSGAPDDGSGVASVSTNEVINQSVAKMEEMMDIEVSGSGAQPMSFITPNYNVDYNNERLSVLRGSGLSMYFSQYLASLGDDFKDGIVYKDTVTDSGVTLNIYAKKTIIDGGVQVTLENHQTANGSVTVYPIQIYFEYDYTLQKPSKTTIVATTENGDYYDIALAQFDYATQNAYSYNFSVASSDKDTVKAAFAQKNLTFDKFIACEYSKYVFGKLNPNEGTIESYGYQNEATDEINATQDQVAALYNAIYEQVKNACVPIELLDTTDVTNKVYYQTMWQYGVSRVTQIK